jgi:hypothetical protein
MMQRLFLHAMAALALTLAVPAPAEAAGGGGGQGGLGASFGAVGGGRGSLGASLGTGSIGHGSFSGSLGTGGIGHGGASFSPGGIGGMGHFDMGHGDMGLGANPAPIGLGLTRGIGTPGGDDIHLGLSSRELGLGNNFGLDAPDNVLSRATGLATPPGLRANVGDRQGLDLKGPDPTMGSDTGHSQGAKNFDAGTDDMKGLNFKKVEQQVSRSKALQEQEWEMEEQQLEASLPQSPPPPTPAPTTAPSISQGPPTLPESSTVVTTTLGGGEASMIGTYFAQHGAPVSSVPTSSVNVSVGGTVPDSVALFPPPYDLVNQVSDPNFSYFVWGQNLVIVDGQTNVVSAIVPDVLGHQD